MKKSEIKFIVSLDEKNIPEKIEWVAEDSLSQDLKDCLLYTSPSPRDLSTSRMPSSA